LIDTGYLKYSSVLPVVEFSVILVRSVLPKTAMYFSNVITTVGAIGDVISKPQ